jgi:cysteine-rich repeat protein
MQDTTAAILIALAGLALSSQAHAAPNWRCEERQYGDEVCDCGCGRADSDCSGSTFEMCERSGCAAGQVPWEHSPESCMSTACGDGWVDAAAGEVCDDGEALAGGGCAADCKAVNAGWRCGQRAERCVRAAADPDVTESSDGAANGLDAATDDAEAGSAPEGADGESGDPTGPTPATDAGQAITDGGGTSGGAQPASTPESAGCAAGGFSGLLALCGVLGLRRRRVT